MAESNFVDYVKIYCRSGKGGRGSTHMRRAKYVPNGGPDGGDGGRGGHVILRGNRNYWTLLHLRYDRHIMAGHGESGSKNRSFGKDGEDKVIEVPCGTVVYNAETGEYICDVTEHGQEVILLKGGRGGLGNWHFKTATRQAPRFAQPGEPMQEMTVIMELKLLADVGLVGFPNAGKSIPGIIEGASEGRGLGLRFLRHIERNSLLLFMVPADSDDITKEYNILLNELKNFNPEMLDKQRVLAITKCDMLDQELMDEIEPTLPQDVPHVFISAISGLGINVLKDILWEELNKESNKIEGKIESIAHRPKDMSHLKEELADEGEDEDLSIEYVDEDDIEDLEDFEYEEEDWKRTGRTTSNEPPQPRQTNVGVCIKRCMLRHFCFQHHPPRRRQHGHIRLAELHALHRRLGRERPPKPGTTSGSLAATPAGARHPLADTRHSIPRHRHRLSAGRPANTPRTPARHRRPHHLRTERLPLHLDGRLHSYSIV